jgi:DNA phosphorothioation-dependent restriction protein DptG
MAAKRLAFAFCALGFLQTSFAGFERFWIFSKDADTQVAETWETLSDAEQRALIQRYQSLKELPEAQSTALHQRMDWFTQLPEQEKQKMRETWQKMSSQERKDLGNRMQKATAEERPAIRDEYITKYLQQPNITTH